MLKIHWLSLFRNWFYPFKALSEFCGWDNWLPWPFHNVPDNKKSLRLVIVKGSFLRIDFRDNVPDNNKISEKMMAKGRRPLPKSMRVLNFDLYLSL